MNWCLIKEILPALLTAAVAIIGFIIQFLFFFIERKQRINDARLTSVGQYYFGLMRHLGILNNNLVTITGTKIVYKDISDTLFNSSQDCEENLKDLCETIFAIYHDIDSISSSGHYMYMNKKVHKLMLQLINHIAGINYSRNKKLTTDQLNMLKSSCPLPDIALLIRQINAASK